MVWRKYIDKLPSALQGRVQYHLSCFQRTLGSTSLDFDKRIEKTLCFVWAISDYVAMSCAHQPSLLSDLQDSGDLFRSYEVNTYPNMLEQLLSDGSHESELMAILRHFRRREMVRIIWRDLTHWAEIEEIFIDLSKLAEACLNSALTYLHYWQTQQVGIPYGGFSNNSQKMIVLAMGKLGGGELNLSSDIDLIFVYPEEGETQGEKKNISNEEYFTRLARSLIRVLSYLTPEGFVFRVDTRLRPDGDSGPLVSSFDAIENYYQYQGRDWERYAMVKMRAVVGEQYAKDHLIKILHKFTYHQYLESNIILSLKDMKSLINKELQQKKDESNIKLGLGGIREIEFIVQSFQLIYGGEDPNLQEQNIFSILNYLIKKNYLPSYIGNELRAAYIFLRQVENCIQAYRDEQTHTLPATLENQIRLSFAMGYEDWESFSIELNHHRNKIQKYFEELFTTSSYIHYKTHPDKKELLKQDQSTHYTNESIGIVLNNPVDYSYPKKIVEMLEQLEQSWAIRALSKRRQIQLKQLIPLLLEIINHIEKPEQGLQRLVILLEAIAKQPIYFDLLLKYPKVISQLANLCIASPFIARQLTHYPVLLAELLNPNTLYQVPKFHQLTENLEQLLSTTPSDLDQKMDVLRHFRHRETLRAAVADITGALPLMRIGDYLTYLAEVIIKKSLELSWQYLINQYGYPCNIAKSGTVEHCGFIVVGYGKLGGYELGYGSDLDLVFLYDVFTDESINREQKTIHPTVFYSRLGQHLIQILQTLTPLGKLYDIDMRLRPGGTSGLLVNSFEFYKDYQYNQAWIWEHQALVRARFIAGDKQLATSFATLRNNILSRQRNPKELQTEICSMRSKMHSELDRSQPDLFDLKQGRGGIADIEFIAQYGVLAWSHKHPSLLKYPDNIRIIEELAQIGLISLEDSQKLTDSYRAYRAAANRLSLQEQDELIECKYFDRERSEIQALWVKLLTA
ncbi:bifunctional [glutamate--ammonia ligase]-adenylyl-L-tyrosine phosphorylase/[glutamate--ammonia-ligase] adenylyltransferase [Candidatus Nitrosacidococcus sp. I8]|uniref:bifunctional [glutamate--ammonia ligase]-adenylyl-L-tyrosine phosphorylase/[glutamate--ammonia-ligase] adenylyltransferase n=1 Tax=Candidatus Nitrosacidococcus sp. I8 TaxID=2942908 RepID=UPI0029D41DBD|nr:bifunctional [glutamate--ammonia ligase]-adenylyl-L-tyrosine phosphorylase/[glutamate--ammonia-ligase] adenylyltransferase [Candidatus Nitrosacidococcus sp. I8]